MVRKILLACGIAASLTYLTADALGGWRWEAYDYLSQTVSELSAVGAPSRPLVVPLFFVYSLLALAFGVGVWQTAGRTRARRILGALLIGYGLLCLPGPLVPMHLRGAEGTLTDTLHIAVTIVNVLFILLILGYGAGVFGAWFRAYSIATIAVVLLAGTLAGLEGPRVAANLPTPWLGAVERLCIYPWLVWSALLAAGLYRQSTNTESTLHGKARNSSGYRALSWRSSHP